MDELLPSRIESLGDSAELPADTHPKKLLKPKIAAKQEPAVPPVETEEDEFHQIDERA